MLDHAKANAGIYYFILGHAKTNTRIKIVVEQGAMLKLKPKLNCLKTDHTKTKT